MLSRVANAVYWMSRYIERAENVARFIDVNQQLMLDQTAGAREQWMPLISITGDEEAFTERYGEPTRQDIMHFLTFDLDNPNSIASCVSYARENARTIRDTITEEMWEQINALFIMVKNAEDDEKFKQDPYSFYQKIKRATLLFIGITDATMSRFIGWEFTRLGRMIERADKTSRILDVKYFLLLPSPEDVGGTVDIIQWAALLRSASALEMYRQTYGAITPKHVAEFLILNNLFPRSLSFCVDRAARAIGRIAGPSTHPEADEVIRKAGRLRSELEFATVEEIIDQGMHEYLDMFQHKLNELDDTVHAAFFPINAPAIALASEAPA